MASRNAYVSLCHQCGSECEDARMEEFHAEADDDGGCQVTDDAETIRALIGWRVAARQFCMRRNDEHALGDVPCRPREPRASSNRPTRRLAICAMICWPPLRRPRPTPATCAGYCTATGLLRAMVACTVTGGTRCLRAQGSTRFLEIEAAVGEHKRQKRYRAKH